MLAEEPGGFIEVILSGARMPSTKDAPAALAMPGFGDRLSDEEAAALASFVRQGWQNEADPVSPSKVQTIRKSLDAPH